MTEPKMPKESAMVEVSPETEALVKKEMPNASDVLQQETIKLFEAIKMRAESEAQAAGEFTREAYLKAVTQAREAVEKEKLFDPTEIERSINLLQQDLDKNWNDMVKQVTELGDRLSTAADAAWKALTEPFPGSDDRK